MAVALNASYVSTYQDHVVTGIVLPADSWVLVFEINQGGNVGLTGVTVGGASASYVTGISTSSNPAGSMNEWGCHFFSYWNTGAQTVTVTTTGSVAHDGLLFVLVVTGSYSTGLGTAVRAAITTTVQMATNLTSVQNDSLLVWGAAIFTGPNPGSGASNNTVLQSYDFGADACYLGRYDGTPVAGTYTVGLSQSFASGLGAYFVALEVKAAATFVSTITLSSPTDGSLGTRPMTLTGVASPPGATVSIRNKVTGQVLGEVTSNGTTGAWTFELGSLE